MTALAFNKPVVATSVGGIPEIIQDTITGKLVPPRNHSALADAIIDLLINPQKREIIKNNIEIMCSRGNLSWNAIAQQTMEVYSKAIKK
jgi:glycosyltransferase involved in cell wall biosynthesis